MTWEDGVSQRRSLGVKGPEKPGLPSSGLEAWSRRSRLPSTVRESRTPRAQPHHQGHLLLPGPGTWSLPPRGPLPSRLSPGVLCGWPPTPPRTQTHPGHGQRPGLEVQPHVPRATAMAQGQTGSIRDTGSCEPGTPGGKRGARASWERPTWREAAWCGSSPMSGQGLATSLSPGPSGRRPWLLSYASAGCCRVSVTVIQGPNVPL